MTVPVRLPGGLRRIAQHHIDRWSGGVVGPDGVPDVAELGRLRVTVDEGFCREVAVLYERAVRFECDPGLLERYEIVKFHNRMLYDEVTAAGVAVRPWTRDGQPYRDSRDLRGRVVRTGALEVFLTARGHGPLGVGGGVGGGGGGHPLRGPSGVRVDGTDLQHNDLFRVVHDLFGHVMFGHSFGPAGELLAARCQMQLYPRAAWPVVFAEQVGQVCWFYHGPHRALPPGRRPYPEQKVLAFPDRFLDAFAGLFRHAEEEPPS
ncbi:hypothetical protein [Actinomadura oligospora]|uniref:hypothetical protein n=1 Tax=Actinomadura oligospora TaxID=111804 RepID=UPI000687FF4B|nr:hypothetical protein [Actinomadura oligospora]